MNRNVEWADSHSGEIDAHKGTIKIYPLAASCPGTAAKGDGRPRPATVITCEATCDAERCELFGNWPNKAKRQLAGRHDWSEMDGTHLFLTSCASRPTVSWPCSASLRAVRTVLHHRWLCM